MKQLLLILLVLFGSVTLFAQTKKISFKSHSGNEENFPVVMEEALFDMDGSNFGVLADPQVLNAKLDSVIFISDSVVILVTTEYYSDRITKKVDSSKSWRPGREIVYLHPLFSKNHSLDSIKQVIKEQYNFQNPINKVVFVGYDNKGKNKNYFLPIVSVSGNDDGDSFNHQFFSVLGYIVGLSLLALVIILEYYKYKEKRFLLVSA